MPVSKKEISPCPIDAMLSVVDGRWKGTILWRLLDEPMRTSELRRSIPGITERMLIRHLQELVSDGILLRHEDRNVPPSVRYSISEYGMTLVPVLEAICEWGRKHLARLGMACEMVESRREPSQKLRRSPRHEEPHGIPCFRNQEAPASTGAACAASGLLCRLLVAVLCQHRAQAVGQAVAFHAEAYHRQDTPRPLR